MKTTEDQPGGTGKNHVIRLGRNDILILAVGGGVSLVAAVIALAGGPGAAVLRWLALLPVCLSALFVWSVVQARRASAPIVAVENELKQARAALSDREGGLVALREVMAAMGETSDQAAILDGLIHALTDQLHFERGLALLFDEEKKALVYGAFSHAAPDPESQFLLEQIEISIVKERL